MGTTLPRQGASTNQPWSLTRDSQFRTVLEAALTHLHGPGVVSGGAVTHTTGFSVEVASGSVFWDGGTSLTLSAAQSYTAAVPSATVYVWAKITRTAATQSNATASDTYALTVTHNTTGVAPSDDHFPLAVLTTDVAAVTDVDNEPAGKYVRALPQLGRRSIALTAATTTLTAAQYRDGFLRFTGSGAAVVVPAEAGRRWYVENAQTTTLLVRTADGTGITVAADERALLTTDGTDVLRAFADPLVATLAADVADLEQRLDELDRLFNRLVFNLGVMLAPELVQGVGERFARGAAGAS